MYAEQMQPTSSASSNASNEITHWPREYLNIPQEVLAAPDANYLPGATYDHHDLLKICTALRYAIKTALEDSLQEKFKKLGGTCRVYYYPVVNSTMNIRVLLSEIQVAWFPEWCIDYIVDDESYLRKMKGWLVIDMAEDVSSGSKFGVARSTEDFEKTLSEIAKIIQKATTLLGDMYEEWVRSEFGIGEVKQEMTTDQLYSAMEGLLIECVPEIPGYIKNMIAAAEHNISP